MTGERVLKVQMIKGNRYDSSYAHTGLMFAHCSKITNNVVKQMTGFCSCREDLASCLFYDKHNKIPIDRSRYIVRHVVAGNNTESSKKWFSTATEAGLRIVNIMEDRHGWLLTRMIDAGSSTSRIPADHFNVARQLTTFYKVLLGSSKWVKSPHMISLYILLFRIASHNKFKAVKNYDDFSKACNACTTNQFGDAGHVFRTFKFWDMIMANFDEMFAGMPTRDNFKGPRYGNDYYDEGTSKLCRFKCKNEKINNKFVALADKAGLR